MSEAAVDFSIEREWDVVSECVQHADALREAIAGLSAYLSDIVTGMEDVPVPTLVGLTRQREAREAIAALRQAQDMLDATDVHLEAALNIMGYAR